MAIGFFLDLLMETEKIFPICQRFATAIAARFLTIWPWARENQTVIKLLANVSETYYSPSFPRESAKSLPQSNSPRIKPLTGEIDDHQEQEWYW